MPAEAPCNNFRRESAPSAEALFPSLQDDFFIFAPSLTNRLPFLGFRVRSPAWLRWQPYTPQTIPSEAILLRIIRRVLLPIGPSRAEFDLIEKLALRNLWTAPSRLRNHTTLCSIGRLACPQVQLARAASSVGRAPRSQRGGRGFKSRAVHQLSLIKRIFLQMREETGSFGLPPVYFRSWPGFFPPS